MKTADLRAAVMKTSAFAYKEGSNPMRKSVLGQLLAVVVGMSAIGIAGLVVPAKAETQRGESAITCTNPFSGATWQIRVDYDQRTVDSNPADINDSAISWRDATNGWSYELDRKSGKLTVTLASATGGNFLHDQCKLDN
jgi:hypothetical protein